MTQPWASLLVHGEILYETRSWKTNYRGKLAIHATKKIDKLICNHEVVHSLLIKHGYTENNLPTGEILATCNINNCYKVIEENQKSAKLDSGQLITGIDFMLGDFKLGYYAWELSDISVMQTNTPAKGKLGLWEFNLDDV
jgi:activating signal cointegrator 1